MSLTKFGGENGFLLARGCQKRTAVIWFRENGEAVKNPLVIASFPWEMGIFKLRGILMFLRGCRFPIRGKEKRMSREEAIEILSEMRSEYNLFGDAEEATRYHVLSWAIQAMKETQTERKKGKWITRKDVAPYRPDGEITSWTYKCEYCGTLSRIKYNYCHNCGAKMDEVEG